MDILASSRELRAQLLKPFPLFRALAGADLLRLAGLASLRHYAEGEVLFRQGTAAEAFLVVLEGSVQIARTAPDGREQILHVFGKGQMVGEVPVFRNGDYPATGISVGETRALFVPRAGIVQMLRETPDVALAFLAGVCERLRVFVDLVDGLALKDGTARLAGHLLRLRADQGRDDLSLPTTKAALAQQLGMVPETLSRRLRDLQAQALIRVQGRTIHLLDLAGLRAVAGE